MELPEPAIPEAWLAAVGVSSFLGGGRVSVSSATERAVRTLPAQIARSMRDFLRGAHRRPPPPPRLDMRAVAEAVFAPQPGDALGARLVGFPTAVVPAVATLASRAVQFVRGEMPPVLSRGMTAEYREPSPMDVARFEATYLVADDPRTALDALVRGDLSSRQVAALRACYPELHQAMRAELVAALLDVFGSAGEVVLPPAREAQLWIFEGGREGRETIRDLVAELGAELERPMPSRRSGGPGRSTAVFRAAGDRRAAGD